MNKCGGNQIQHTQGIKMPEKKKLDIIFYNTDYFKHENVLGWVFF